eukprot:TRINITY_DN78639_c0_g1_i1.p1 TRINITY_DN78639_c0_g1~~TRINITY_DN78639_c0_g1_i1.p1  ORF type:complete len:235 (-),score=46.20 TRINITY_DN78639_c0_g1_i1:109-756(-)
MLQQADSLCGQNDVEPGMIQHPTFSESPCRESFTPRARTFHLRAEAADDQVNSGGAAWNRVRTPSPDYSYRPRSSFEVAPIILMPVFVQPMMEDFLVMEESPAEAWLKEPLSDADIYAEEGVTTGSTDAGSTDADEKTSEIPPPPSPILASVGSANHPHGCAAACKYAGKARGCKDGPDCDHCHLCKYRGAKPPVVATRKTWRHGRRSKQSNARQ